jgi:LmbE family N-acetylglucosaminyl deacetylase
MPVQCPRTLLPMPLVALLVLAGGLSAAAQESENERLLKTDLMVVTAHPDDEGMVAATMARCALDGGRRVALVSATRGEGGGNGTGKEYGEALGIVREAELRACAAELGVRSLHFLDRRDFAYTESATATLERWNHRDTLKRLVRLVRALRPDVIVTMDPAPRGGQHGHHQVAGRLATEAFEVAVDPRAFPELSRDEGLKPWRVLKLYYATWSFGGETGGSAHPLLRLRTDGVSRLRGQTFAEIARRALSHHRSQGFDRFMAGGAPRTARPDTLLLIKSRVSTAPGQESDLFDGCADAAASPVEIAVKPEGQAVPHDRPFTATVWIKNGGSRPLQELSLALAAEPAGVEPGSKWRAEPLATEPRQTLAPGELWTARFRVTPSGFKAGSLARLTATARGRWATAPGRARTPESALARTAWTYARGAPRVEVAFRPSEQLLEYRRWSRAQGLDWLVDRLPARVPLTIGRATRVEVEVTNHGDAVASEGIRLTAPAGWRVAPAERRVTVKPRATSSLSFEIALPASTAQGDVDLTVATSDGAAHDTGRAEALPLLIARRLASPIPVDADLSKWSGTGAGMAAIPPTAIVSGEVSGPQEASARILVGYDAAGLQVLADVTDDTLVANIAPDDIRGHWRTTSVEICVDPAPRAENTLRTLKLGIFPADLTGRVRAARDADANPGPVDRVDPGIQLASRRTATGYVIEVKIPWSSLPRAGGAPFRPAPGRQLGFNVILYHAGKKDAGVGEDVGKARLAWAARGGVWGRPASWGMLELR